jgi:AcrR family transcriptional regulator
VTDPTSATAKGAGRANQKARTRAALVAAAAKLVREGRPPSIPEAAAEALVSVPTAYRYFARADDLWAEASFEAVGLDDWIDQIDADIESAGSDVVARALAASGVVDHMLADQAPFRRLAKASIDQWFAQREADAGNGTVPVRAGRRNRNNEVVVAPLRGSVSDDRLDRLVRALGLISGTEAMIALTDALDLEPDAAMDTLHDAVRWLVSGALAEAGLEEVPGSAARSSG